MRILQLELQHTQTLLVLSVEKERACGQDLETDILIEHLVVFEQGVDPLVIFVAEVALAHQEHDGDVAIGQSQQFVAEENGIRVIMQVEVLHGEVVKSLETLVGKDGGGEGVEFGEEVLGVGAVVGLEDLGHEEGPLRFDRCEDSWFLLTHRIQI